MHLESGKAGRFRTIFQNRGKAFWVPIFTLGIALLGFGIYSAVRAVTPVGSTVTISVANNYRHYTYDSNAIYYGVSSSDWKPWSTRWYNVAGNDAMCLQAWKNSPSGSGPALSFTDETRETLLKRVMLATVPSYSDASVAAGGPNYYSLFNASYDWSSKTSAITNLMTRDTNIVYGSTDPRYRNNGSTSEDQVKYVDYYYGCSGYYTSCDMSLSNSEVDSRDAIFAVGHMIGSSIYNNYSTDSYFGLNSSDKSVVDGVRGDINSWFGSHYPNATDAYEVYVSYLTDDASKQTVGWLEYAGTPVTRIRFYKASTTGAPLAGAVFSIGSSTYTTGSDGYTSWIEVDPGSITYYETTAPSGYVGYTSAQSCTAVQGSDVTCTAQQNRKVNSVYVKINKLDAETLSYAARGSVSVVGSTYGVYNSAGAQLATITIGSDGTGTSSAAIAEGTGYYIKEISAATGYTANTSQKITFNVTSSDTDGSTKNFTSSSTACTSSSTSACYFTDTIIKGKFSMTKTGYELSSSGSASSRNLGGISFTAVNQSDSSISYTVGPTASNGSVTSPDMIYGTYTVTEIRSSANNAYDLLSFTVAINSSSTNALGTKQDTIPDTPGLTTVARNSSSTAASPDKEIEISASAGVTDHITCSGLQSGSQYQLRGQLWDISANTQISPTGTSTFTGASDGSCGSLDMAFSSFDSSPYMGKKLGIKQYLYKNNGTSSSPDWVLIFIHNASLSDTDEQVTVKTIEITTTANSERSSNKELAAGKVKVLDTYEIVGLVNGQTYTLKGYVKDASGNTIVTTTNTISMTLATGAKYTGVMEFELDSTPYVGQTLYVTQELYLSGGSSPIVTHTGTASNGETVTVLTPTLITNATNNGDGSKELEVGDVTVKDIVTYEGLAAGSTYTIKGELWKLNADGSKGTRVATSEGTISATSENGSTSLTFSIDAIEKCAVSNKLVLPCKFVVFEYLYYGGHSTPFSSHENVADTAQIVSVKTPTLATVAKDSQNETKDFSVGTVSPIDEVTYTNLVSGQRYILVSYLVDASTGAVITDADGNEVYAREEFPASAGTAKVTIDRYSTFDSTLLYDYSLGSNQKKFVIYQTLYYGDIELVSHSDLTDADQTLQIGVPKLATSATWKFDGSHFLGVGDVTMKDYVDYEGLVEGEWYTIVGSMIDPETGNIVEIDNEFVENSKSFKADTDGKGTVALEINLNTVSLQGRSFVVYERLYRSEAKHGDGRLLVVHEPELDEDEQTITVKVAKIETVATDKSDGDNVLAYEADQTIHDVVSYDGLLMDEEYTLYGYLYDKTNNRILLDADGKRIEASTTFTTPTKKDSGEVEMDFSVDAHDLPGAEIVVYEYLFAGSTMPEGEDGYPDIEQAVTKHADPNSANQTVRVSMRVGTEAVDAHDNDHTLGVGLVNMTDTMKYEGAKMGKTYKAKGWLVIKSTGEVLEDVEGETIFTVGDEGYEETTGYVTIEFEFDSRTLIGETLVVYEELYLVNDDDTEELVAEHKDLTDADQTVLVATPEIHTTATNSAGGKELATSGEVTIVDVVKYTGLVRGTTYVLHGELIDKVSGDRLSTSGVTEVTWEFVPDRDSGEETIEFTITVDGLAGKAIVVFEELYISATEDEDEVKIAEHKDLNDEDQTTWVGPVKPNTGLFTRVLDGVKQGDPLVIFSGLTLLALGGWLGVRFVRNYRLKRGL